MFDKNKLKLIILDRDGVVNYDSPHYIKSASEWAPIPGSIHAIARLSNHGFKIALATNQSGLARGYFEENELHKMHAKMQNLLQPYNAKIDMINYCHHLPDDNCSCRKPGAGMLIKAMHHFNIEKESTLMIGDSLKDIQAAHNAGCFAALVKTGNGNETINHITPETQVFTDLAGVADYLLS